jgi:hypothetical protein
METAQPLTPTGELGEDIRARDIGGAQGLGNRGLTHDNPAARVVKNPLWNGFWLSMIIANSVSPSNRLRPQLQLDSDCWLCR